MTTSPAAIRSLSRAIDHLARDTRHTFRALRKHPAFTAIAVATIGLGMGFNTTLFTAIYGVMYRPLPVQDAGSLRNVYVEVRGNRQRATFNSQSFQTFREFTQIREGSATADVAGLQGVEVTWKSDNGVNRSIQGQLASDNLLALLKARPVRGRFFSHEEAANPGSAPVVVLSHRFWQQELMGRSDVVGSTVTLNRTAFTVIGVADSASRGPLMVAADVWIPLTMQALTRPGESLVDDPNAAWIQTFARARPGVTEDAMAAEMRVLAQRAVAGGDTAMHTRASVVPAAYLNFPELRKDSLPVLGLIWLAFGMILLVACANVANMLLARGLSRQREIAVRLAIGADRRRLIQQLLTESAWLGLLGGALGLALALGAARVVPALIPVQTLLDFSPDVSVLAFAAVVSFLSGVIFGLLPAFHTTGFELSPSLKADAGTFRAGRPRLRAQNVLVGLQMAASVILLTNAGLVVRGFNRALTMEVGKPLDHLVIAKFDLRQQQYTPERAEAFFQGLTERLSPLPGTVSVGASMLDPEVSSARALLRAGDSATAEIEVSFDEVTSGYFAAAGLRVLAGRTFTEDEVRRGDPIVVIDRRLADEHFGGRALGQKVRVGDAMHEIVGVVNNTVPMGVGRRAYPTYFAPLTGGRYLEGKLWLRYRGALAPVVSSIRTAVKAEDPDVLLTVSTIEENVRTALLPVRIASWALSAMGALALLLAAIGLFGVIAYTIGSRTREIAIRLALGAAPRRVLQLLLRQGLRPVFIGGGIGLVLALGVGQVIRVMIYGVSPFDPVTIGSVLAVLCGASGLAFWIPARRAARVQPGAVLRSE